MDDNVALVTGANGFTGRYVMQALSAANYSVRGWSHGAVSESQGIDLTDRQAVRRALRGMRPRVVVHLAAISFVAHEDVEEIYRVNVSGTRNLLEGLASLDSPPRRVVIASSANVYGNVEGMVDEDTRLTPQNDYAVSKAAMEMMARLWAGRLPIAITRPFNYTGVGQSEKFLIPKIVSHFRRRAKTIELGNIDVSRDFNDVRNVARIYARLADADVAADGETLNICTGQEHSLRGIVDLMREISGHAIEIDVNPDFVRANEVRRLLGDPTRLAACVGSLPAFSLPETLRWMYLQQTQADSPHSP